MSTNDTVGALSHVDLLPTGLQEFVRMPELYETWRKFSSSVIGEMQTISMTIFQTEKDFLDTLQFLLTAMCQSGDNEFYIPPINYTNLDMEKKVRIEKPLYMTCNKNTKAHCLGQIADSPWFEMLQGYVIEPYTNKERIERLEKLKPITGSMSDIGEDSLGMKDMKTFIGEYSITKIIPSLGYCSTQLMHSHLKYDIIAKRLKRMQQAVIDTGFKSQVREIGDEDIDPVVVVEIDMDNFKSNGLFDRKKYYERMDNLERNIKSSA
jgi:hypothetical protein